MDKGYDPLKTVREIYEIVCKEENSIECRKYYRFRGGRWYGGIATADAVGCNLKCKFCWGWRVRDNPSKWGRFYSPNDVYIRLMKIVRRRGYSKVRVSGGEPTISRKHLIKLLELFDEERNLIFILETNGILIGADKSYAKELSKFKNLHVRVSLKGTSEEEFHFLTGASPDGFKLQLKSLENLLNYGVSCHPAVMLSFSREDGLVNLINRLKEIDEELAEELEEEYCFLYPHVIEILRRHGLKPRIAYSPDNIPEELI